MNLNEQSTREKYKEFYGKGIEQMELLIKDKRIPLTVKQIIERRLNTKQSDWKDNYFDTCDAIVNGENGKFKIVKSSKVLLKINKNTKLENGVIKITKEQYQKIKGKEYIKKDKEKVWKYLLEELYEPYIKLVGFCPKIYIFNRKYSLGATCVNRLGSWSQLGGVSNLDYDYGRFVGVASEMLEVGK